MCYPTLIFGPTLLNLIGTAEYDLFTLKYILCYSVPLTILVPMCVRITGQSILCAPAMLHASKYMIYYMHSPGRESNPGTHKGRLISMLLHL